MHMFLTSTVDRGERLLSHVFLYGNSPCTHRLVIGTVLGGKGKNPIPSGNEPQSSSFRPVTLETEFNINL
jgi:hypothetical protein